MCGITAIHMNRALKQLKDDGLADFRRGAVYVPDRKRLGEFAGFDPAYLYGTDAVENGNANGARMDQTG